MTLADRVVVMDKGRIQQLGTPVDIYDRPANVFVAGFIGSPAMNLVRGEITDGIFWARNTRIAGFRGVAGPVTLGFRAEDAVVAGGDVSEVAAPIYSVELLGDATMVTVRAAKACLRPRPARASAPRSAIRSGSASSSGLPSLRGQSGDRIEFSCEEQDSVR